MLGLRVGSAAGALLAAAALLTASVAASTGGTPAGRHDRAHATARTPLDGNGMWIWYLSASEGGDLSRIANKALNHRIKVLLVKSSDGSYAWSQFGPDLVAYLHSRGLRVCAWQFIYGVHPVREAEQGAAAVADGADCLVIDAESQFEGNYAAAQRYVRALRERIPSSYPVALASFPYVDYHPGFPYSVFLGPGGAQYNAPQVYWHTIGTSPENALLHTFVYNRVYRRPLKPVGQTYGDTPTWEVQRFRRYTRAYRFGGRSWWDWQSTPPRIWHALARPVDPISGFVRPATYPVLARGSSGDLVVWAQEHLRGAGRHLPVTGYFGDQTERAVRNFQRDAGLDPTGVIDATTWRALLKFQPEMVNWTKRARSGKRGAGEPRSASLPAVRYEIPTLGAGPHGAG